MVIAFDIFRENGMAGIAFGKNNETSAVFPCDAPCRQMMLQTWEEMHTFTSFFNKTVRFFEEQYNEPLEFAYFVVPYDFSYLQKARIKESVKNARIPRVRCCNCLEVVAWEHAFAEERTYFFCQLEKDRIEVAFVETGSGVVETIGASGIRLVSGEETQKLQKRLTDEINLLFKETVQDWNCVSRVVLVGRSPHSLVSLLEGITGKKCYKMKNNAVRGLVDQMQWMNKGNRNTPLLLPMQHYNLWAAMGESGEKDVVINRYSTIPTLQTAKLLISTEKTLYLYEGNYMNPRFDTRIAALDLSRAREGSEIECEINIDANGEITASVKDEKGEMLIPNTVLPAL